MSLRPTCQCQYEIENNLPRTKHCFVACAAQRQRPIFMETCEECGLRWNMDSHDRCPNCFPPAKKDDYNPIFGDLDEDTFED